MNYAAIELTAAAEAWPDPQPLSASHEPAPYPLDSMPVDIRLAISEVIDFVQCPASIAACSALATLSLASQALADVERAPTLTGPTSLYLMAIAESGERKSTADKYFKAPLLAWEAEARENLKPQLAADRAASAAWEAKKEALLQRIKMAQKGGKPTGIDERELQELEKNKPAPSRWPQLLFAESTPEALAWSLSKPDGWPSGAVIAAEAGVVLGSHGMGKDSVMRNLALLNELWDGTGHNVNRRTSENFSTAGTRLTMGIAAQRDVVREFIDRTEISRSIGFLARFLVALPTSNQGFRSFREPSATWPQLSKFSARITKLLEIDASVDANGKLQPKPLTFNAEAKTAWIQFHEDIEAELRPGGSFSEMKDVASKAADNAARLAALFHIYREGPQGHIRKGDVDGACAIVTWHLYEARRFLGEMVVPQVTSDAMRLSEWLSRYCKGEAPPSVYPARKPQKTGTLSQRIAQIHGPVRVGERFRKALEELDGEAAHIRQQKDGAKKLLRVNPALWTT